jgi:hypothetical protein
MNHKHSIFEFLTRKGFEPEKQNGNILQFSTPLQNGKLFCFTVNGDTWHELNTKAEGNLSALVCKIYNVGAIGAALILNGSTTASNTSEPSKPIKIEDLHPIKKTKLLHFIEKTNKVPAYLTDIYLQEASFLSTSALAFKNDFDGWQLINRNLDKCSGPSSITTIEGNHNTADVFDNVFDFLRHLKNSGLTTPENTCIVLNSWSNIHQAYDLMPTFKEVNLYVTWQKSKEIQARFPDAMYISEL